MFHFCSSFVHFIVAKVTEFLFFDYQQFAKISMRVNSNNGNAFRQTGHSDFALITNIPFIVKSADLYAIYPYNY
jgi:hypothetical protein